MRWFVEQSALIQGFIATLFTYGVTAAGAAVVLAIRCVNKKVLDVMMSFSAGVMIAASYWSLLEPAFALAKELDKNAAVTVTLGFFMGGLFIVASDILLEKRMVTDYKEEGFKRCILLITAVTMHNVPGREAVTAAIMLAVGIGIQNFPEGICVAMPLRREGISRAKSFLAGQFSGMVEPIAGVLGALFALTVQSALPMALSFSAGAMIAVVCSELIPESFKDNKHLSTAGVLAGFVVMMLLDVSF